MAIVRDRFRRSMKSPSMSSLPRQPSPKHSGVRYRDRNVLVDLDADPAFERARGPEIDQQAQEFFIPNGDRDATAGRRARAPRRGRNETVRIAVGPVEA